MHAHTVNGHVCTDTYRCAEARSFTCMYTQTPLKRAANIHMYTQIDLHAHTCSQTFTNFSVDTPHRYTVPSSQSTWHSPTHAGMRSHTHSQRDVFQGEGTVQGSLASHPQKLRAAPAVSGQLWAKAEPWPLYVCRGGGFRGRHVTMDSSCLWASASSEDSSWTLQDLSY